jgi:predicted O-methyltransferase YrrM
MNLRHLLRSALLASQYMHPAVLGVALRRGPQAARAYLAEIYRCSKTDAGLYVPTVRLDELVSEAVRFVVHRPPVWDGSLTITEIASLCMLVAAWQPRKILEIGTFKGLTTLNLALNAPEAIVHTLDLPPESGRTRFATNDTAIIARRGGYHYADHPEAARIRQHLGDSASYDFAAIGPDVDLALIDAAHSYAYVRNDTARTLPLLRDQGVILWHDYGRNDVLASPQDAWGVSQLIHELADLGVRIVHGTSLAILVLDGERRRRLAARLEGGSGA